MNPLLTELHETLESIRLLPEGSYPQDFSRPELESLIGTTKSQIVGVLGSSDYSGRHGPDGQEQLTYFFFVGKPHTRGGGGFALCLTLDKNESVSDAGWAIQI